MKNRLFFLLIIILALALRLYKVNEFPVSLYWDEVAIGYNAYSILKTGKDEYGKFLPLSFESFQDTKIPGYIYLTVLSEAILGVNEFAVRLPSVILGIGSVVVIYFLTLELFYTNKSKNIIALLACFIFTIVPWALQFSRAAFEANGGLFFSLLGIYFFLYFLRTQKKLLQAVLAIVLSFYFYYQQRLFFPPFLFILSIINIHTLLKQKKQIIFLFLFSSIVTIPIIYQIVTSSGRLSYVSVFSRPEIIEQSIKDRIEEGSSLIARFAHNRYLTLSRYIVQAYMSHFSPDFLFISGDANPRHGVTGQGALYLWMLPFLILGFIYLWREDVITKIILLTWIFLGPVAASLAVPTPHALRSLLLLPPLVVIISFGITGVFLYLKKNLIPIIFFFGKKLLVLIVAVFMFNYLHSYYIHEKERSLEWADGYKKLYTYLKKNENNYEQIFITGKYWRPYIFMLFHTQYNPQLHQLNPNNSRIGKYYFGYASYDTTNQRYDYKQPSQEDLRKLPNTLLALSQEEIKETDSIIKTIYSVTGKPVFIIIESNSKIEK